jgi:predicted ester cyclase
MTQDAASIITIYVDEIINKGDLSVIDAIIGDDFIDPAAGNPDLRGPHAFREVVKSFRKTFSNINLKIDTMVIDNSMIAWSYSMNAVHSDLIMGRKATGRTVHVKGIIIDEVIDGKIRSRIGCWDRLGLLQQIEEGAV